MKNGNQLYLLKAMFGIVAFALVAFSVSGIFGRKEETNAYFILVMIIMLGSLVAIINTFKWMDKRLSELEEKNTPEK
jgi:Na+/melibiose symporter-like transporter